MVDDVLDYRLPNGSLIKVTWSDTEGHTSTRVLLGDRVVEAVRADWWRP